MNAKHTLMSERKLGVRANYTTGEMLAQLKCDYADWLSEGHEEDGVFGTLKARVNPLVNGFYGWPAEASHRLLLAWREFEAWREGQRYLQERGLGPRGPYGSSPPQARPEEDEEQRD